MSELDILKQYGLPGLCIIALVVALKILWTKNNELVKETKDVVSQNYDSLLDVVKEVTRALDNSTNVIEKHNELIIELKTLMLDTLLKDKSYDKKE